MRYLYEFVTGYGVRVSLVIAESKERAEEIHRQFAIANYRGAYGNLEAKIVTESCVCCLECGVAGTNVEVQR